MFGWAKPVPVSAWRFRNPRRGMALVAAAGPAMNFFLAWLGALALHVTAALPGAAGRRRRPDARAVHPVQPGARACSTCCRCRRSTAGASWSASCREPLAVAWARLERAGIVLVLLVVFLLPRLLAEIGISWDPVGQRSTASSPGRRDLVYRAGGLAWLTRSCVLHLEGFDGPMDLLLELARGQKLDLARISILSLVEQYLAIIEGARRIRLELAADWLVMAAWLAWLKSRLLLPPGTRGGRRGRGSGRGPGRRGCRSCRRCATSPPGSARGRSSATTCSPAARRRSLVAIDRSGLAADLPGLLRAYTAARRRAAARTPYQPRRPRSGRCRTRSARSGACSAAAGTGRRSTSSCRRCRRPGAAPRRAGQHAAGRARAGPHRPRRPAAGRAVRPHPAAGARMSDSTRPCGSPRR